MVGVMLTYGRFKFLNLTDLDWATEMKLACPVNKLGKVTRVPDGPPWFVGRCGSAGIPRRDCAPGHRLQQRSAQGARADGQERQVDHARGDARRSVRAKRLRPGREAPRHRRHLAGTPVAAGQGPEPQHLAGHDREPRRDRGVQGTLDQGVRGTRAAGSRSRTAETGSARRIRRASRAFTYEPQRHGDTEKLLCAPSLWPLCLVVAA